jgi:ATP-binding cassette subfamily C protein LapB
MPERGSVLIDGVPVTAAIAPACGAVAIVDHANAIVRGSVLNNLTLFRDAEQLEAARAAVRLIGFEDDINHLPRGYDTPLGGAATETLPLGFLQRIVIARALAGKPSLLILDEANNAFDHGSDVALGRGLASLRGKITIIIIIITNRPSFAAISDRQFTLVDGKFCQIEQSATMAPKVAGAMAV